MNQALIYLITLNFLYIGLLPKIFFRKDGKYNLMWFVTAGPLFWNAIVILLVNYAQLSISPAVMLDETLTNTLVVVLSSVSIGFISYTIGTHRVPLALWHQTNDKPASIVTWGAYKYLRHPFYTSFLTTQLASVILYPHLLTIVGAVVSFLILNFTAAKEEAKLSTSQFGSEYKDYKKITGRFFPKLV